MIRTYVKTITTTGGAGTSSGSATISLTKPGYLKAIGIDYTAEPATTDVTLTTRIGATAGFDSVVFSRQNSSTDLGLTRVVAAAVDGSATAVAASAASPPPVIAGVLTIAVAQGDNNGTVKVVLVVDDNE